MKRSQQQNHRHRDQLSCVIYELSTLVLNILRYQPTPMPFANQSPVPTKISAVGFAWLMLGISASLMLCGSVTFFLGFMLMPWVLGLLMVFYVAGILFQRFRCWVVRFFVTPWHLLHREKILLNGSFCEEQR